MCQAYTFFREFVLGSNQTGLVEASGNVVGGENPTLQQSAIPGQPAIDFGVSTTQGSTQWPSATVAAFESYIGQAAVTGTEAITPSQTAIKPTHTTSAAVGRRGMQVIRGGSIVVAAALANMLAEMV